MAILFVIAKSNLLTGWLILAVPASILIIWWTTPPPDWFGKAYPYGCEAHIINRLQILESDLIKIRREKKFKKWKTYNGLSKEWQLKAMITKELAFELFLVETVWNTEGENYSRYRLEESQYKNELKSQFKIIPNQPKKISQYA